MRVFPETDPVTVKQFCNLESVTLDPDADIVIEYADPQLDDTLHVPA